MKFRITSWRGDHQATIEAPEVAEAIFRKLTGQSVAALPESLKAQVPDTFQELEALWNDGIGGYTTIALDKNGEIIGMKEFNPEAEEVVFFAPIAGG
jgi:hypothetical protein